MPGLAQCPVDAQTQTHTTHSMSSIPWRVARYAIVVILANRHSSLMLGNLFVLFLLKQTTSAATAAAALPGHHHLRAGLAVI